MRTDLVTPCVNCPFRSDKPFPLRRAGEIARSCLTGASFACHKTVNYTDDFEEVLGQHQKKQQWCAGALIFMMNHGALWESVYLRLMAMSGDFNQDLLDQEAFVYDSVESMIEGCSDV